MKRGAGGGIRTHDQLITNQPLCQLSYAGLLKASARAAPRHITDSPGSTGGISPGHSVRAHSGATTY
jgi:hypothetical protein